jgi:hypothetical protein
MRTWPMGLGWRDTKRQDTGSATESIRVLCKHLYLFILLACHQASYLCIQTKYHIKHQEEQERENDLCRIPSRDTCHPGL